MGSITKEHDNLTPLGLRRGLLENVACHTYISTIKSLRGLKRLMEKILNAKICYLVRISTEI